MQRRAFITAVGAGLGSIAVGCRQPIDILGPAIRPTPAVGPGFLFATGIENSYPRLPDGSRHDQLDQCGHYHRWRNDFELACSLGVGALRYGPAWYRTNPAPGVFDWSSSDDQMAWLRSSGITVIGDLCHFGVPDWIDGFRDPALPAQLAAYARAFARRYPWVDHFTPINEMFVAANFSSMLGWWNECSTGHDAFMRTTANIAIAHERAVDAILAERSRATIVQVESFERFVPADTSLGAMVQAQFWNEARFAALDLTLGRTPSPFIRDAFVQAGVLPRDLTTLLERRQRGQRWIGMDYYVTSEQLVDASGRKRSSAHRVGLAALAMEYHARYRRPLFLSETSRVATRAVDWLNEQWSEVGQLLAAGIPVRGFTWFPLGDVVDWRHALREKRGDVDSIGLYNLEREAHSVAAAYSALIARAGAQPSQLYAKRLA
ncbi:MAG TPA: family 1 glycosylhydrolase [Gemmatimonadaceae bacterium]|nr:family 1 glycosylhydrolase [Gemmatimonadaceae bacterium]